MITSRPSIPAERYRERISAAQARAAEAGLSAILVGVGADLRYLTGYPAMPLERLTMLVIPATGTPSLVAPRLEATPARACPPAAAGYLPVVTWEEADDAHALGRLDGPRGARASRAGEPSGSLSPTTSLHATCCACAITSPRPSSSSPHRSCASSGSSRTPTRSRC